MSKNATFIILDCSPAMLDVEAGLPVSEEENPDPNSYFCRAKEIAELLLKRKVRLYGPLAPQPSRLFTKALVTYGLAPYLLLKF